MAIAAGEASSAVIFETHDANSRGKSEGGMATASHETSRAHIRSTSGAAVATTLPSLAL